MIDPAPSPPSPSEQAAADLWADVLRRVLDGDGRTASAALAAVTPVAFEDGTLRLEVPSAFHRDRLVSRHLTSIRQALRDREPEADVDVELRPGEPAALPVDQLTLALDETTPATTGVGNASDPLDPRLNFEAFIVGRSNRLAQAAALSVAENTTEAYNPLFIHGESGNGKTHLLHAIGLHVREHSPSLNVQYVTLERFTGEFIEGIRGNSLDGFKRRYRACDLLLVDDVQFLENKEATQDEFFHTFNEITTRGGRVVLTADRHPGGIPTLPDRLLSRFKSGLLADLQAPEFETRVAILRKKAQAKDTDVPEDVLSVLASTVTRNVRELEGVLIRVLADARLENRPVSLDAAIRSLEGFLGSASRVLTLSRIIDETADVFGVDIEELCSPNRSRQVVGARQAAMYVCRSLTEESLPSIGRAFGGRDHTTVLHAVRKIEKLMMTENSAVHVKVVELMSRLGGPPPSG